MAVVVLALAGTPASAQQENPVYVDDSPRAWELFRLAQDQATNNVGEAVRLYQELLDDYAMKLLPVSNAANDHFLAVRSRVLAEILADRELLDRFRLSGTAEARRLLEVGQLERLARTRSITVPGLQALLRLAQDDLEHGWFHSALDRLQQAAAHPDLGGREAAHCWYMIGVAAHYLGRPAQLTLAVRTLTDLGPLARALREQLDRLVVNVVTPGGNAGISTLDGARASDLDQLVGQPIWSMTLSDTPLGRYAADAPAGDQASLRHIEQMRQSGALLTAAPTVADSSIYLNEGRTIHGVDRFTGRPLWPPHQERLLPSAVEQGSRQIADMNIVAVRGGALVTITGHAYADAGKNERAVVCLDRATGRQRWVARIDHLSGGDDLEGLFPYGAPIIGDGMVYVAARKVSRQLLTSCYVIALDLDDGHLVWARHVASSGGIRTRLARPFSNLLYYDGDLAMATAIGAVARIDATTGQTRWLRRYNPPLSPFLAERKAWEMTGPVMTSNGLVVLRPDHRRVILLDWDSGDELKSVSATGRDAWNSPQYLLSGGPLVFGVGAEVRAFSAEALDRPVWTFPDQGPPLDPMLEAGRVKIRGRVQLVAGGLIVPVANGLLLLDDENGRVVHRVDVGTGGNPVAAGPQMVLASSDQLAAYMPLARAEQMLRQQIATAPEDAGPALALMRLGVRVRDLGLSLEAAELVIDVLNARPSGGARQELFEILLELDRERVVETIDQGEALHAMIGLVAQEPIQRVEHLLAYGDWLVGHALGAAIETYQTVLSTPILTGTLRSHDGLVRPASAWAARRIGRLIETRGRRVYQPQADFAEVRLGRLRRAQRRNPRELVELAREFPFADSGLEAAREAAIAYAAGGDLRLAVSELAAVYRLAPDRKHAVMLLGLLAGLSEEAGWTDQARSALGYIIDTYGDTKVLGVTLERDAGVWLGALQTADVHHPPRVGDFAGIAERLSGSLVPLRPQVAQRPPDRALLYDPPQLALIDDPAYEPGWVTVLGVLGDPSVLRFDARSLLLWVDAPGDDPRAVMLDPADGSQRWITPVFAELIKTSLQAPGRGVAAEALPGGMPFNPNQTLPLAGRALVVVRRSGEAMALDLGDGTTRLWERIDDPVLEQVHLVRMNDVALVVSGIRTASSGEPEAVIVVVDPDTGDTLHEIAPRGGSPVRWMALGPLGTVTYGNAAGFETVDALSGATTWARVGPRALGTLRGWIVGGSVITESPTTRPTQGTNPLAATRLADGALTDPFDAPDRGDWDRMDLKDVIVDQGRIFGHYGQRVVRFARHGTVLGADVVSDQRQYEWLLPAADRLLLVSIFKKEPAPAPRASRKRTHYTYRLYALSANCKLMGDSFQLPVMTDRVLRAAVIDGWLLLSTPSETLAVAMPPGT